MGLRLLSGFVLGSVVWGAGLDKARIYITDVKFWILGGEGGTTDRFIRPQKVAIDSKRLKSSRPGYECAKDGKQRLRT